MTRLRDAVAKAANSPAMNEYVQKNGMERFVVCGDDFAKLQQTEMERWGRVIREAKIEPQ